MLKSKGIRRKLLAECFGTYCLVFAGTGAIIVNETTGGSISHVGVAITFGLVVLAMIYSIGNVSGCHLNPAVTISFFASRKLNGSIVAPYILSQVIGATLASLTLRALFPEHLTLGATIPAGSRLQSFALEFVLTLILMFVILSVCSDAREQNILAGIAIGSVVALEAMFAGPICGASMNPARSIGPAIISWKLQALWIYVAAPITGALSAVYLYRSIHGEDR